MSDTPRTDAVARECYEMHWDRSKSTAMRRDDPEGECVDVEFVRGLEREITKLKKERDDHAANCQCGWDTARKATEDADKKHKEIEKLKTALRQIKKTALTCTSGSRGLGHITRLCIDAGITEKLPDL